MEEWETDFEWLKTRHYVKDALGRSELPDLRSILLLIGIQEAHKVQETYTKEKKQDLMHVATCHLLTEEGYFEFVGKDADNWPHFTQVRTIPVEGEKAQERLLKHCVIKYFKQSEENHTYV